jgi:lipid A 4'-phosphatase
MNRIGLMIALGIAATVGLLFGLYPELDLKLSDLFFDDELWTWLGHRRELQWLRRISTWLIALVAAPAFVALALKLLAPRWPMLLPGRAVVFMIATLTVAPGLIANVVLKDYWGRPRPIDLAYFHQFERFVPWWDPRGECPKNCSFVAGEPAGAFWTLAPAAVVPPAWRALAFGGALAFGAGVGVLRMAGGGHFFSDVAFAGIITYLIIWLAYGWLYRWPATRTTDAAVERALESLAMPVHRTLGWIAARRRGRRRGGGADEMS